MAHIRAAQLQKDSGFQQSNVFSNNCDPFEAGSGYSKFAVFTLLNHDGSYSAAAQALREQGYGMTVLTPQQQKRLEELFIK